MPENCYVILIGFRISTGSIHHLYKADDVAIDITKTVYK